MISENYLRPNTSLSSISLCALQQVTRRQLLDMEFVILKALMFQIGTPYPLNFLRRMSKSADAVRRNTRSFPCTCASLPPVSLFFRMHTQKQDPQLMQEPQPAPLSHLFVPAQVSQPTRSIYEHTPALASTHSRLRTRAQLPRPMSCEHKPALVSQFAYPRATM